MLIKSRALLILILGSVCPLILIFSFLGGQWSPTGFFLYLSPDISGPRTGSRLREPEAISETFDTQAMYRKLFSISRPDHRYFDVTFKGLETLSPNILPHPGLTDTWVVVAQAKQNLTDEPFHYHEISCNAVFEDGNLRCIDLPFVLPITATYGPHCQGELEHLSLNVGPHDARVFYGPTKPFTIYGSNSAHTCFGQWLQDFRVLVGWTVGELDSWFQAPMDMQRPAPYHSIEKNWFLFWDDHDQMYVHHEIYPQRIFTTLYLDGSVGENIASMAEATDAICLEELMPKLGSLDESIHQATNSLSITLCKRNGCQPNNGNTFIMTIFQHKTFRAFHSVYEPYVILFKQQAPFEIYGISRRPFWIHGRGMAGEKRPNHLTLAPGDSWNQTEMLYVTSMSWMAQSQTYHGYLDDVLFVAFGIEDYKSGAIDIAAGDLVEELILCA